MTRDAVLLLALTLAAHSAQADAATERRVAALRALTTPTSSTTARTDVAVRVDGSRCRTHHDRTRTERAIRDASLRFGVDPRLVRSVIREESAGNPDAVSHKGAQGLMQLMPATARALGVTCPFDPRQNILGGTRYLRRLKDQLGTWPRALAAYNAGPGAVLRGLVPAETRRYVERVLGRWSRSDYRSLERWRPPA